MASISKRRKAFAGKVDTTKAYPVMDAMQIVKQTATAKFPTKLSESGIFTNIKKHQVDPGLVPYSVNAPVWADGALQERFLGIPGKAEIDFPQYRGWNLPEGTVLVKTLSLEAEPSTPNPMRTPACSRSQTGQ